MSEPYPERIRRIFRPTREFMMQLVAREDADEAFALLLAGGATSLGDELEDVRALSEGLLFAAVLRHLRRLPHPFAADAIADDELEATLGLMAPLFAPDALEDAHLGARHQAWYELGGRRVFELCPDVAARLRRVEHKGFTTDDLTLPAVSLYLSLPPEAQLRVSTRHAGALPCEGVFITEDSTLASGRAWHLCFVGTSREYESSPDDTLEFRSLALPPAQPLELLGRGSVSSGALPTATADSPSSENGRLMEFVVNAVLSLSGATSLE